MCRRLTAFLVIVCMLMYGTAWAFDGHWSASGDHSHAIAHGDPVPLDDDGDCDHCCHAAAHFVGIVAEHAFTKPFALDAGPRARDVGPWLSISLPPPTRPPRLPA